MGREKQVFLAPAGPGIPVFSYLDHRLVDSSRNPHNGSHALCAFGAQPLSAKR